MSLLSILIIICCFIFVLIRESSYNKKYKELESKLTFKAKEDASNYFKELNKQKQKASEEYEQFLDSLNEKRKLNEAILESEKALINEKLSSYERLELEKQIHNIQQTIKQKEEQAISEYETLIASLEKKGNEYKNEILAIQCELDDLKVKRHAVIEALRREEEVKLKQSFYTIELTDDNKKDIRILRSIEDKLTNKDALNRLIYDVFIKKPLNELLLRVIGEKTQSGIYKITHIPTQKSYIGKSVDVKKRLTEHVKGAFSISTIADQHIHRVMGQEGVENFTFELLEPVTKELLNEREKYWINYYQTQSWGYNKKDGG